MAVLYSRYGSGLQLPAGAMVGSMVGTSGLNPIVDRLNSISTDNNLITGSVISGTSTNIYSKYQLGNTWNGSIVSGTSMVFNGSKIIGANMLISGTGMQVYSSGGNSYNFSANFFNGTYAPTYGGTNPLVGSILLMGRGGSVLVHTSWEANCLTSGYVYCFTSPTLNGTLMDYVDAPRYYSFRSGTDNQISLMSQTCIGGTSAGSNWIGINAYKSENAPTLTVTKFRIFAQELKY